MWITIIVSAITLVIGYTMGVILTHNKYREKHAEKINENKEV